MIIAEFLINDFRFWCDVEEGFLINALRASWRILKQFKICITELVRRDICWKISDLQEQALKAGALISMDWECHQYENPYKCYRNQAEAVHQQGNVGKYSSIDENNLHLKAQLICEQFLNSPILPRCRINIQPEVSATIIENVKLGMFDLSLFHDCTINIFPLLLIYWKKFCMRRHKYIPRADLLKFKIQNVQNRHKPKKPKKEWIKI